jgi:hypothetical protein
MALATLVQVPEPLSRLFVKVPRTRVFANNLPDPTGWPGHLQKPFRLPDGSTYFPRQDVESFARETLEKVRSLPDPQEVVEALSREIGKRFKDLIPVQEECVKLSASFTRAAGTAEEGEISPAVPGDIGNFDLQSWMDRFRRNESLRDVLVTKIWVLYYIAQDVDKTAALTRLEDRCDQMESKMTVLECRLEGRNSRTSRETVESDARPRGPARRPPAPSFNGEKHGTDVVTWLGQFEDYSSILGLQPDELVSHAALCLTGRAAKEWAFLKKALSSQGKNVRDFEVFKASLLSHFVEAEVENTVRVRLSQLKQNGSVAAYHAAFRAIMVEAVKFPISGPEACSYFRAGLKPHLLEILTKDSTIRNELANLDVVVQAAKEAEAFLRTLPGAVLERENKARGKRPMESSEMIPKKPRPASSGAGPSGTSRPSGPSRPAPGAGPSGTSRPTGGAGRNFVARGAFRREGRCYECGKEGHIAKDCQAKGGRAKNA